jgi:hypothetical protein
MEINRYFIYFYNNDIIRIFSSFKKEFVFFYFENKKGVHLEISGSTMLQLSHHSGN